jgi:hypothetical protein
VNIWEDTSYYLLKFFSCPKLYDQTVCAGILWRAFTIGFPNDIFWLVPFGPNIFLTCSFRFYSFRTCSVKGNSNLFFSDQLRLLEFFLSKILNINFSYWSSRKRERRYFCKKEAHNFLVSASAGFWGSLVKPASEAICRRHCCGMQRAARWVLAWQCVSFSGVFSSAFANQQQQHTAENV